MALTNLASQGYKSNNNSVLAKPTGITPLASQGYKNEEKNVGGILGGIGYLGEKAAVGFVSSLEGIVDYTSAGFAKLFGADDWAEEVIKTDWFGDWYSHPEEWFNPGRGWQFAGDVAGGIGTSLPGMAAALGTGALIAATGGAAAPVVAAATGGASFLTAGLGAAGRATKEAYEQTGKLTGKEFGYGALTGATEGGIEGLSNIIGMGTGQVVKSFTKAMGRETAEAFAKQGLVKTLGKGFIGEAFEESASEILDPYWKRATYDKNARNASVDEILYSGLVGGFSGMLMGGTGYAFDSANSYIKGNKLSQNGGDVEVLETAGNFSSFEELNNTEDELFGEIKTTRESLLQSLNATGGKVQTVQQKRMLGSLSRSNVAATAKMFVAKRAVNVVNNAETIAQRLTEYGYKTADGKPITFTAEEITAGYDPSNPNSIFKALKTNEKLRNLAVADATGRLMIDSTKFAQATLTGKKLASQVDLNRFVETAHPKEIAAVSKALGIESWAGLTVESFEEKITEYVQNGGVQNYLQLKERKSSFAAIPVEKAQNVPRIVNLGKDGVRRYTDGKLDIAVERKGDEYTIYDYSTDNLSKSLTRSEVNSFLREYNQNSKFKMQNAELAEGTPHPSPAATPSPAGEGMIAEIKKFQSDVREIDSYARENIKEYKTLNAPNQSMIRKVIREGRAKGIGDSDLLMYAKISAHSGLDIQFDKEATLRGTKADGSADYADGFYEADKNRIVVNPEGKRTAERLLIHELDHAIRKYFDSEGKQATRIYFDAIESVNSKTKEEIRQGVEKTAKPSEVDVKTLDETNAYYAEHVLGNKHTLEKLLGAEPTLKDKILSFFKGASSDYADVPKLSGAAKKYYRTYKKLFDEFSARNAQSNASETVTSAKSDKQYAFAGVNAKTADKMKLATAEQMLKDGKDSETVRRETGWFKGYDGKWRFEIDDSKLKVATNGKYSRNPMIKRYAELVDKVYFDFTASTEEQSELKELDQKLKDVSLEPEYLGDMIEHPQLFAAYPQLQGVKIAFIRGIDADKASYHPGFNEIALSQSLRLQPEKLKKVLSHEIQHAIQEIEGLAGGSNVEMFNDTAEKTAFEQYYNTAGEIEARDVANRLKMSEEQRKNTRPDIDRKDVVFADGSNESFTYIGDTADDRRCYQSGYDSSVSFDERIKLFKERIATIFNLGAVELKTDVKKIKIKGDRFTSQKNLFGDKRGEDLEYEAKVNSLYDLADMLATATYDPAATNKEPSYVNPKLNPKNAAHKNVKYWYKFRNNIVFDGVPYEVTFNIRDKGKEQYQYLIDFKEDKTPGLSNTAVKNLLRADQASYNISISQPEQKSNTSDKISSEISSGKDFALDIDSFYANGEEFATPTLSTVGKERVSYEEKLFSKEWRKTKSESAYIHAVDEMYGVQSYLEKVGKAKNAKATIQTVRSTPHQVQTMIGSVQYNIFKGDSKTAKKMGEGLNEIFRPIEKMGEKTTKEFNDYLLHNLNIDKYNANERMKRLQEDAVESLHKVQDEIKAYEKQKNDLEDRIFSLGDTTTDKKLKQGNRKAIEGIEEKLAKLKTDESEFLLQMPLHAESELKSVNDRISELMREKNRIKQEIFESGNTEDAMAKKKALREQARDIYDKITKEKELADKLAEIVRVHDYALKPVFNLEGETMTKEDSERYVSKYDSLHPEFKKTAEKVWNFNKNLNEMRVSAQLISRSFAQRMATMYPHYVPSFRSQINNSAVNDEGIAVTSTVKKAKGYNSNIMNVKESIASQVAQVARNGNINLLANKVYDTAVQSGDSKYVDIGLPDPEGQEISKEGSERPKPHTLTFFKQGKEYQMNVSDEIYAGFKGVSEASAPHTNVFARVTNWITDKYKKLVTSYSPAFMIRNAIRDLQDAGLNSKHPLLFAKSLSRAWVELVNNSENWQTYRAYGGFSSTVFDSKGVNGNVDARGFEILGLKDRIESDKELSISDIKYLKSLFTGVENVNAAVEQIPRFAEYLASIEAGETIEQAIYNSAEVTTNFGRRGATTKTLNSTIIPFLNPAIQGFDKIFRNIGDAAKAGSAKEVTKAMGTLLGKALLIGMLPMLFNSLMYDDDEDYKDLREEDKENNYLIKLPNGTFLKLPRGRVASVIAGLANRGMNMAKGEDPDWAGYASNVVSQVTPVENLTRTVFSPFMDVANNRTWYGTEIEGQQFDNVRPEDRYDESTSSIAIAIGKAFKYSPKKIHYLIDQYSGVIGDFLLPATTQKAEKDFFSGNFTLDPVTSNKISNRFYEIYDEAQYSKTDGSVKAQYQVKYLNKVKSATSELYKEINAIQNSDLSSYEKLQQTRVLRVMINEALKNAIADYEQIGRAVDATEGMGFNDSDTGEANIRYAEIIRQVYGSERALSEYNGTVYSNMTVLNSTGISYDKLYDYYFGTKGITSDKDREGNSISGSKRKKVVAAINRLGVSVEQRLLLICASGYSLKDGDIRGVSSEAAKTRLLKYILKLRGLTAAEKGEIAEMCGFQVKNGKIIKNSSLNLRKR